MQIPWALQAADGRGAKTSIRGMTPLQWLGIKQHGVRHLHAIQVAIMKGDCHLSSCDCNAVLKVKTSSSLCYTCIYGAEKTLSSLHQDPSESCTL